MNYTLYKSTNNYVVNRFALPTRDGQNRSRFLQCDAVHIRQIREDFNDMFKSENESRLSDGDMSIVFVLTYRNEQLRYRFGRYVVDAEDLSRFSKSSRLEKVYERAFGYEFDFISVGEYGEGGITHGVVGIRGKGNNPHFHCCGWFHCIGDYDLSKIYTALQSAQHPVTYAKTLEDFVKWYSRLSDIKSCLYDWMCFLLRHEWQSNNCQSIQDMSKSPVTHTGLGFCKLDGKIQFSGASAYLSKYMGKDMLTWHKSINNA